MPTTLSLKKVVETAKAVRARTAALWGPIDDAALDAARDLDPNLHPIAAAAIERLTQAVGGLTPTSESSAHASWRTRDAVLADVIARCDADLSAAGAADLKSATQALRVPAPSYDAGGAESVAELASALGAVVLLLA